MKNGIMKNVPRLEGNFLNFQGEHCIILPARSIWTQKIVYPHNARKKSKTSAGEIRQKRPASWGPILFPDFSEQYNSLENKRRDRPYIFHSTPDNINAHDHYCSLVIKPLISSTTWLIRTSLFFSNGTGFCRDDHIGVHNNSNDFRPLMLFKDAHAATKSKTSLEIVMLMGIGL